ncbi:MAG: S8 family serine peptidase [Bryobacteraceae bacterium]
MRKRTKRYALAAWAVVLSAAIPSWAETRYVVEAAPGTNVAVLGPRYGFSIVATAKESTEDIYTIATAEPLTADALKRLSHEKGITEVEANHELESAEWEESGSRRPAALEPLGNAFASKAAVDYYGNRVRASYSGQRAAQIIALPEALRTFGAGGGVVAIIDTGVDTAHPALRGALVPGYDFTRDRPDTVSELYDLDASQREGLTQSTVEILDQSTVEILDSRFFVAMLDQSTVEILDQSTVEILDGKLPKAFGHGTMVAGLVHLVAPQAKIMPLKAFRSDGTATIYDIARAIRYAADHGAGVINMSLSYTTPSEILRSALEYAQGKGAICVASAGNRGREMRVYPASYKYVVGVGSTNFSDRRSPFSNYGDSTLTAAPGEALVTLFPGGHYAAVWGTSFSSALASGSASLMRSLYPQMRSEFVKKAFDHGIRIRQEMGDGRIELMRILTYCLRY